jgi:hypothetical protein
MDDDDVHHLRQRRRDVGTVASALAAVANVSRRMDVPGLRPSDERTDEARLI